MFLLPDKLEYFESAKSNEWASVLHKKLIHLPYCPDRLIFVGSLWRQPIVDDRNDPKTVEIIKVRLPVHQVQHAGGSCDYVMTMGSICLKGTIQCFAFDLLIHFGVLLFIIWFFSKVKTSAFDKRHLMAPVLSDSRVISRDCFPQTLNKVGMEFVVAAMIRMCLFLESPFKKQIEKQTRQRESKL